MAHALLKNTFDDEVVVQSAEGTMRYTIIDIRYGSSRA